MVGHVMPSHHALMLENIKPPTLKPTWEPTRHPIFKPTFKPISSEQEKTTSPTDVEDWQQPPTLKPTLKPTGDRCRANPCDEPNQCRSKLGFCGVGIIYCNSESSWEPECDANYGANGGPSQAPSTLFDSWLNKQPDVTASDGADSSTTPSKNPVDGVNEESTMSDTYSSPFGIIGASFNAALHTLSPMLNTHSSLLSKSGASINAALFHLCPMLDAHSSPLSKTCAPFTTASFDICSMLLAHSFFVNFIFASFSATYLHFFGLWFPE